MILNPIMGNDRPVTFAVGHHATVLDPSPHLCLVLSVLCQRADPQVLTSVVQGVTVPVVGAVTPEWYAHNEVMQLESSSPALNGDVGLGPSVSVGVLSVAPRER